MGLNLMHCSTNGARMTAATAVACAAILLGGCVTAPVRTVAVAPPPQRLYVYPAHGQTPEQQDRDRYQCHVWAVQQTGVDPSRAAAGPYERVVVQPAPGAATVAGAVGGAIVGSMIGGDDHPGVGALLGGVAGAMIGSTADANAQAQARLSRRQVAAERAGASAYRRAISACLEARGYTVS